MTRRIGDVSQENPSELCRDLEHLPPDGMCFEPGVWEHICPGCGTRTVFVVNRNVFLWKDTV